MNNIERNWMLDSLKRMEKLVATEDEASASGDLKLCALGYKKIETVADNEIVRYAKVRNGTHFVISIWRSLDQNILVDFLAANVPTGATEKEIDAVNTLIKELNG